MITENCKTTVYPSYLDFLRRWYFKETKVLNMWFTKIKIEMSCYWLEETFNNLKQMLRKLCVHSFECIDDLGLTTVLLLGPNLYALLWDPTHVWPFLEKDFGTQVVHSQTFLSHRTQSFEVWTQVQLYNFWYCARPRCTKFHQNRTSSNRVIGSQANRN